MKKYILTVIALILSLQLTAQKNEYRYFSIKLGYSQGLSGQPSFNPAKYLNTPVGEMQLAPVENYLGYMPGFTGALYYHFDMANDMAGIYTGVEYNNYGVAAKYQTVHGPYTVVEQNRMNAIGIPIGIKIGPDFYEDQRYFFLGTQFNFNLSMSSIDKVSWDKTSSVKLSSSEFQQTSMGFFAGFNWMVLNVALVYYPGSFFNKDYFLPEAPDIYPYSAQNDNMFFVNVAFHVPLPLSKGWVGTKSYKLKRFFRKMGL